MRDKDFGITIHFASDISDLYTLGYVASDLYQMWVYSELIQKNDRYNIERFYGEKAKYFNRYVSVLDEYREQATIKEIKRGSVELYLGGATLVAAVVMPIVAIKAQTYMQERNQTVTFNVNPDDPQLANVLDAYKRDVFGSGNAGVDTLAAYLKNKGYSVKAISDNIYDIERVTDRYGQRIAKTIRKHH